jgi:hypothetical protein
MKTAAPGQLDLFDLLPPEPEPVAPCIYDSPVRGLAARIAEFEAWKAVHGTETARRRSHAWQVAICSSSATTEHCQPTILNCDLWLAEDRPAPPCGHRGDDLYRACCRRPDCLWEGRDFYSENLAAEDGMNHAWPGWRDLPIVPDMPYMDGSPGTKANTRKMQRWAEQVNAVYPAGWLEAGGPIRTARTGLGTRHVNDRTPYGGYDMAVVVDEAS